MSERHRQLGQKHLGSHVRHIRSNGGIMSEITTTESLVTTMRGLVSQGVQNLTEFAVLTPSLYAEAPWKDETDDDGKPVKIAAWFIREFGVGPSKDGYVSLPQVSLDAGSQAFADAGIKPPLSDHVAVTGAARATVARSRARTGLSDDQPQKRPTAPTTPTTETPESGGSAGEVSSE